MLFVGTSIIHPSTEGVFLLCNILDLLIYSYISELDEFKNSVDKLNKSMIRFIDISKIDDSVEQRIKEQGAGSQQ